jgi:hypothetical protein
LDTCGPVTFHALMRIVHNDSYESMELVKEELIALKLKDFLKEAGALPGTARMVYWSMYLFSILRSFRDQVSE